MPACRQAEDSVKAYIAVLEAAEKAVDWALSEPEDLAGLVLTHAADLPLAQAAAAAAAASMQQQQRQQQQQQRQRQPAGGVATGEAGTSMCAGAVGSGGVLPTPPSPSSSAAAAAFSMFDTSGGSGGSSGLARVATSLGLPLLGAHPASHSMSGEGGGAGEEHGVAATVPSIGATQPLHHTGGGALLPPLQPGDALAAALLHQPLVPPGCPTPHTPPPPPQPLQLPPPAAAAAPAPAAAAASSGTALLLLGELARQVELVRAEELLEWYLAETESNLSDARLLVGRFDGERKSIQLELANTRNRLLKANMGIQLATMCMAGCSMVSGYFGMNLSNGTCGPEGCRDKSDAGFSVFASVAIATTLAMLLVGTLAWTRILKGL